MRHGRFDRRSLDRLLVVAAVLLLPVLPVAAGGAAEPAPAPVWQRLQVTLERAAERGPASRGRLALLASEAAVLRLESGAGAPAVELQREGIGSSFEDRSNAVGYLRLSAPFNAPWQVSDARGLVRGVDRWLDAATAAAELDAALGAGRRWLGLAAAAEQLELARRRLDRLARAVDLQRARLAQGEVSGSDVTQLELERLRESSLLRAAGARVEALRQELRTVVGGDFPPPAEEDLGILVEVTTTPGERRTTDDLEQSPRVEEVRERAAVARQRSELVSSVAWGRPTVDVEWERVPPLAGAEGFDAVGVRLALPLPWGRVGRERQAEARRQAEAVASEAQRVRLEVEGAARAALASARAAELSLKELDPTLERLATTERSLGEQFRLGAISYLVYIDGLGRLDEIRSQAVEARRALLAARLELAVILADPTAFPLPRDRAAAGAVEERP